MASWLIPVSVKNYDLDGAFRTVRETEWFEVPAAEGIQVGDTAYVYAGKPVSAVTWKCTVTKAHETECVISDSAFVKKPDSPKVDPGKYFTLKAEKAFEKDCFPLESLKEHGFDVTKKGIRRIEENLLFFLESK